MIPDEMNDYERGYEDCRNENEEYISSLESQLSAKEQEITDLKTCVDNFSDMYQEKCTELPSVRADYDDQSLKVKRQADHIEVLRAENERLNDDNKKLISGNAELRKRCEDLEAVIEGLISVCDRDNIDAFEAVKEARRFLNQIKS